jgi:hypothetical protein
MDKTHIVSFFSLHRFEKGMRSFHYHALSRAAKNPKESKLERFQTGALSSPSDGWPTQANEQTKLSSRHGD